MHQRGRIAFITTPKYRQNSPELIESYVFRHLYSLCKAFKVVSTGRTYDFVMEIVKRPLTEVDRLKISEGADFKIESEMDLKRWRTAVKNGLSSKPPAVKGMIELAYDLVDGRLDAIIHLTDWDDVVAKPDSMVLRREANVHNVPILSDIHSARKAANTWHRMATKNLPVFPKREQLYAHTLEGLQPTHRILALIAHDAMKLEMCLFAVQNAQLIFEQFDYILATGTTGMWLKKFMLAAGRQKNETDRIRCCLSGPYGGDIQIAAAAVKKLCSKVIFLQDPFTSHAHETDIRLFEQAVLSGDVEVELATNLESAKAILGE